MKKEQIDLVVRLIELVSIKRRCRCASCGSGMGVATTIVEKEMKKIIKSLQKT